MCPSGKFQREALAIECKSCAGSGCTQGQYATTTGDGALNGDTCGCADCPEGKFALEGHTECHDCPAGRFHNETGVPYCYLCPPGKYSAPSAAECTECEYEKYQPGEAQPSCLHCEKGQFQHIRGQIECRGQETIIALFESYIIDRSCPLDKPAHRLQVRRHAEKHGIDFAALARKHGINENEPDPWTPPEPPEYGTPEFSIKKYGGHTGL
jgi:hypothetical protein